MRHQRYPCHGGCESITRQTTGNGTRPVQVLHIRLSTLLTTGKLAKQYGLSRSALFYCDRIRLDICEYGGIID